MNKPSISLALMSALAGLGATASNPVAHELRISHGGGWWGAMPMFGDTRAAVIGRSRLIPSNQRQVRKKARQRRSHQLGRRARCR